MIEKWFSTIELPLTFAQFEQLPQNRAYKYEYFDGHAWLTPQPKSYHALLDLRSFVRPIEAIALDEAVTVRPLAAEDWEGLPSLFAAAFYRVQPFASLSDEGRFRAAQECLRQTRDGAEGPVIADAALVAARGSDGALIGALTTTLGPARDRSQFGSCRWPTPPPPDAVVRGLGQPHLTWIFVAPLRAGMGVGAALLDGAVQALTKLGYTELASTLLLGNDSSTLWHWRMGFRLLPYPGSMRVIQQRAALETEESARGALPADGGTTE